jgi:hypothetical protein
VLPWAKLFNAFGVPLSPFAFPPFSLFDLRITRAIQTECTPSLAAHRSLLTAHCSLIMLTYDLRDACGRALSLPAVDAYAKSRRLQPVFRASETAAPPATVQKLHLLGLILFSVICHRGRRDTEKNQALKSNIGLTLYPTLYTPTLIPYSCCGTAENRSGSVKDRRNLTL